jgi:acid phosphatase family membrane protein YuiD
VKHLNLIVSMWQNLAMRSALVAWAIAQTLKGFTAIRPRGGFSWKHFLGTGGMPSSHSAFVSGLAVAVGLLHGFSSTEFAISFVLSMIVMYDAAGLRRAAGKQAEVLNKLMAEIFQKGEFKQQRLKELLGHSPFEVLAGALLGILVALIICK